MYELPAPPVGYTQTYTHDFTTEGAGDWMPWNITGSPVITDSPATGGLGITLTGPDQCVIFTSEDAVVPPNSFIQAQMYLPSANGQISNWPALWAIYVDGNDTIRANGEIDLVEGLGGGASFHVHDAANINGIGGSFQGSFTGWHTFSALWEEDLVTFWYDAILMGTLPLMTTYPLVLKYMNQSVGAVSPWYGGPAVYPATTHLSHVSVWTLADVPVTPPPATVTPSWNPPSGYTLVFDDEFSGTALDTSKWRPGWFGTGVTGPVNTLETAAYDSGNVSVSGGYLNLLLTGTSSDGGKHPYTGAIVTSNPHDGRASGGFEFTYGCVEWRVYVPPVAAGNAIANWPACWLDGQDWPTDGEFDVLEGIRGASQWSIPTKTGSPYGRPPAEYYGWHQFGVQWLPSGEVTFYYDGVAVSPEIAAPNAQPMYLIMDNTQGSDGGPGLFPATVLVDWVRVWQVLDFSAPPVAELG